MTTTSDLTNSPSNPKLAASQDFGRSRWYPYYAGYSPDFVSSMIEILNAKNDDLVMDPWNGSGTTTTVCSFSGVKSVGFDLNPAMAVVAKARLVQSDVGPSAVSLLKCIIDRSVPRSALDPNDPLLEYLGPKSTEHIRSLRSSILNVLSEIDDFVGLDNTALGKLSPIACFYLVVLFRAVRKLLSGQKTRNPTWIRSPSQTRRRVSFSFSILRAAMLHEVHALVASGFYEAGGNAKADCQIGIADSRALPVASESISAIVTSPPYCTRIDYAVSTRLELAVLGIGKMSGFDGIRERMLGTTVVGASEKRIINALPATVLDTLSMIREHGSKASSTYYFKTFADYFIGLASSVKELYRVAKPGASLAIVVQDSNYKEVRIDLANLLISQAEKAGFLHRRRWDFRSRVTMRRLNRSSSSSKINPPVESVLLFKKPD